MTPDISIIIATYNVARYIERAVASALNQTDVSVEVILVDDCSTDDTWQVISRFSDPRIKAFQLPSNGGPSAARNKGFSVATGEWIAVLDGDDALEPVRMSHCLKRAREAKADIVVDNLTVYREADGKEFPMFPVSKFAKLGTLSLARFINGAVSFRSSYPLGYVKPVFSAAFIKKHNLRYHPELRIGEDYRMLAEALALGGMCAVEPSAGYRYTVRAGSISHRLSLENIRNIQASDAEFVQRFALDGAARRSQRIRSFLLEEMAAYAMLVQAIKARSLRDVLVAIKTCPTAIRYLHEPILKRLTGKRD